MFLCRFSYKYLSFLDCGVVNTRQRIIGGQTVQVDEYPWHVAIALITSPEISFCSGVIISNEWIVTAATCLRRCVTNYF